MASADYANIKHSVRLSLGSKSSKILTPWPSQLTLKGVSQTGDRSRPKHLQKTKSEAQKHFSGGWVIYLEELRQALWLYGLGFISLIL
jgi:hypothetical protein